MPILWLAQINVNIPGAAPTTLPEGIVANLYEFALLVGALLAFGAIVFGGVKYALAAGNPSGQSDAREWITDALLGLLLLLGAWLVLNVVNPNLTNLYLPSLKTLEISRVAGGMVSCEQGSPQCQDSPAVSQILGCVQSRGITADATTFGGNHRQGSCHFGGTSCFDGSHAIDYGFNEIAGAGTTPQAVRQTVEQCGGATGVSVVCYWEDSSGNRLPSPNAPVDHIHCNVDNAACGCN